MINTINTKTKNNTGNSLSNPNKYLSDLVSKRTITQKTVTNLQKRIFNSVLSNSKNIEKGNFTAIAAFDLKLIFNEYDRLFFKNHLRKLVNDQDGSIRYKLSKRMTSAGGKIIWRKPNTYTIVIAVDLMFNQFKSVNSSEVKVAGMKCQSRLEALMRVFEHELVHFIEYLLWGESDDKGERFQSIAYRIFNHKDYRHGLYTWRDRAKKDLGLKINSRVSFVFGGKTYVGYLIRITKRATVIVEDDDGIMYSDGKKYVKYYIPIFELKLY